MPLEKCTHWRSSLVDENSSRLDQMRRIQPKNRVVNTPKSQPAVRPSGCKWLECDLAWDRVRRRARRPRGAGWASFIGAVEEELIDAFLIASGVADVCRDSSQGQKLVWQACKRPLCDKFPRGSHEMQSWRRKSRICKNILTGRQRLDELLLGEGTLITFAPWALVHELLVLAGQAHKLAAVPVSFVHCARRQTFHFGCEPSHRCQPGWGAEATGLADQSLCVQPQAARKTWRSWLEENTTGGGFGSPSDSKRCSRTTEAARYVGSCVVGEHSAQCSSGREGQGLLFHWPPTDAMRRILTSSRAATGLLYDAVPPRALNELPDQGIEALIDLIMLIEVQMRMAHPLPSDRFHSKVTGERQAHRSPLRHRALKDRGQIVGGPPQKRFLLGHALAWSRALRLGAGGME